MPSLEASNVGEGALLGFLAQSVGDSNLGVIGKCERDSICVCVYVYVYVLVFSVLDCCVLIVSLNPY